MRYNWHVMRKLQAAIDDDPEIDLAERLPPDYSRRLAEIKNLDYTPPSKCRSCRTTDISPVIPIIS